MVTSSALDLSLATGDENQIAPNSPTCQLLLSTTDESASTFGLKLPPFSLSTLEPTDSKPAEALQVPPRRKKKRRRRASAMGKEEVANQCCDSLMPRVFDAAAAICVCVCVCVLSLFEQ